MTVKEIVEKYLKDNKYDGLYAESTCACVITDLMPCCDACFSCEPGYLQERQGESDCLPEHDFYIGPEKPKTAETNAT